ncbi:MAG: hypothetical protein VYB08_08720 [Candidatus Latescibacterota bacterium]|nr:hypothetical protein [Candidatus Latescibacterota bacterium]
MRRGLLCIALLAITSCGGARHEAAVAMPAVRITSGGGVTAIYTGCQVDSAGTVSACRVMRAGTDSTLWSRPLSDVERQQLRPLTADAGLLDWPTDERGNITSRASLIDGSTSRRWTWSGKTPPDSAPDEFVSWAQIVRDLCRTRP